MKAQLLLLLLVVCCFTAVCYGGTTINITPTTPSWKNTLTSAPLAAGTVVNIAAGTYRHSGRFYLRLNGTPSNPVFVLGPPTGSAVFIQDSPSTANGMEVDGSNFVLRNFKLEQGSLGLRLGVTTNVTNSRIEGIEIYHTRSTGMTLNQATTGDPWPRVHRNLTIIRNYIHDLGFGVPAGTLPNSCIYIGVPPTCTGTCPSCTCTTRGYMTGSLVRRNLCVNTLNSISGNGHGIQLKAYSHNNQVIDNVIMDTRGPCILTYGTTYGSFRGTPNQIRRNLCWNSLDVGIQAAEGQTITDNLIVGASIGIGIIPNQGTPANVLVSHNTIIGGTTASIQANGLSVGVGNIRIGNNAIFASNRAFSFADSPTVVNSKVAAIANGVNGVVGFTFSNSNATFSIGTSATELVAPSSNNWKPRSTSTLRNRANLSSPYFSQRDFDCNFRPTTGVTVGAYQFFSPALASWTVVPRQFKVDNC